MAITLEDTVEHICFMSKDVADLFRQVADYVENRRWIVVSVTYSDRDEDGDCFLHLFIHSTEEKE